MIFALLDTFKNFLSKLYFFAIQPFAHKKKHMLFTFKGENKLAPTEFCIIFFAGKRLISNRRNRTPLSEGARDRAASNTPCLERPGAYRLCWWPGVHAITRNGRDRPTSRPINSKEA